MFAKLFTKALSVLPVAQHVLCATYTRSTSLSGQSFVNAFTWQTNPDPNYGRVNYIDLTTSQAKGLVSVSGNQVTLRPDSTTMLNSTGPGRDSFNIVSNDQYTTHVAIFDIAHMPVGCGTWPAVWLVESHPTVVNLLMWNNTFILLGNSVPTGPMGYGPLKLGRLHADFGVHQGEIDIVEGINTQSSNLVTLHTSANCTMPSPRTMSGTSQGTNCDVYETNNSGCGVSVGTPNSYGSSFNSAGGGWYALERTTSFIQVFFWSRQGSSVPSDVKTAGSTVNTSNWGTPVAYFPGSMTCDLSTHLSPFNIVIDLDFCGAWAGNSQLYSGVGCPSTCSDYVDNNPSTFQDAYFSFNALNIYE